MIFLLFFLIFYENKRDNDANESIYGNQENDEKHNDNDFYKNNNNDADIYDDDTSSTH